MIACAQVVRRPQPARPSVLRVGPTRLEAWMVVGPDMSIPHRVRFTCPHGAFEYAHERRCPNRCETAPLLAAHCGNVSPTLHDLTHDALLAQRAAGTCSCALHWSLRHGLRHRPTFGASGYVPERPVRLPPPIPSGAVVMQRPFPGGAMGWRMRPMTDGEKRLLGR